MNAILIYASCYGATRRYAEELSRRTGWRAVSFKELPDTSSPEGAARLKVNVKKALPDGMAAECFHLRGAMDMDKLTFRHKMMMKGFVAMISKTSAGKSGGMADARKGPADFVDFTALEPLAERLKK